MIGVFAAAAKVSTLMVALVGGGMNPITLMAKNCIFTTLMVVLLCKIRRPGTLALFAGINMLVSLLVLGSTVTLLVPMIFAAGAGEAVIALFGGKNNPKSPLAGAAVYDLLSKLLSLVFSWLLMRENPMLVYIAVPIVFLGWLGALGGLFLGWRAVKELKNAGIIAE